MSRVIITIAIGMDPCYRYGLKSISSYATRQGCQFRVIDRDVVGAPSRFTLKEKAWLQKLYILQLAKEYDEVLYLDSDIIVTPDAPNFFEYIKSRDSSAAIAMYNEFHIGGRDIYFEKLNNCLPEEDIRYCEKYFNAGVIYLKKDNLLSSLAQKNELIRVIDCGVPCPEQTYFNGVLAKSGSVVIDLPKSFNFMQETDQCHGLRLGQFFIHYAGYSFRRSKRHKRSKIMRQDFIALYGKGHSGPVVSWIHYAVWDLLKDLLFSLSKKLHALFFCLR